MTLREALQNGRKQLEEAKIEEASIDAWYLLEFVTHIDRAKYFGNPEAPLNESDYKIYMELIGKRMERIPLQHITGIQEFMGYIFQVNEHVLIPRQDTETLVEKALDHIEDNMNVLDMCTGSACIIISILRMCQSKGLKLVGTGVDISNEALEVANRNKVLNEVNCNFIESDLFANITDSYDMIVSNPPYIPTRDIEELEDEVKIFDPMLALDGMEDGLYFYRKITKDAVEHLNDKGYLLFEIGYDQGMAVSEFMLNEGFKEVEIIKDLAGLDRVVLGHL